MHGRAQGSGKSHKVSTKTSLRYSYQWPAWLTKHNPLQSPTMAGNKVLLLVFETLVAESRC